ELISSNKISIILNNSITKGSYILSIPCGNTTIYRIFDVTDAVGFSITYHLDGGVAVNPNSYTNLQTSLNLNKPTKAGYIFVGWYINSSFTTPFNPKSLPYSDLNLYAKYDFALPNIVNKSNNISITYSKNLELPINIVASHALLNQYNTLSYQWYKRANENENFSIINGETNPTLTVRNVSDSGLYSCKVTLTISDTSMTNNPVTKVLLPSTETSILVNIKPYIYDMSNVAWNYNEPIAYDNNTHTVELVNLPVGVTATYTNNTQNNIGIYISTATLIYDDMDGNATATPINNLVWEIRRAKIIITIDNIFTETELPLSDIQSKYSCVIESEYFPNHIKSMQDKLSYLCIDFLLVDTSNPNSKTITATTSTFDIYDITIIDGEYRVIVFSISSNNITATNSKGFVQNCTFTASSEPTNKEIDKILKDKNLNIVQCFNFTFSNLQGEQASISIPLERSKLLQNVSAYIYQDGELIKLQTSSSGNNLNILTDNENAIYVLVTNDISKTSNAHIFVISIIICIYIGLYIAAIVSAIKHRNSYYF
ncbi:MAG: InlB B-repeat-containing protein, partial [Clostridia bacterium]